MPDEDPPDRPARWRGRYQDDDYGSSPYMPRSPDPTEASKAAVQDATAVFRREIAALAGLHERDLDSLRELLAAQRDADGSDRARLWERARELHDQFDNALTRFRTEVGQRDHANRELVEQRLSDLDKAIKLAADALAAVPDTAKAERCRADAEISRRLASEREYMTGQLEIIATGMREKFAAIDEQFSASKTAVDAALSAAKEAVAEQNKANSAAIKVSEGNTKEQLTSLGQVSAANFSALEDKITDARDRLTVIESLTRGIKESGAENRDTTQYGKTFDQSERLAVAAQQRATIASVIAGIATLAAILAILIPLLVRK